MIVTMPPEKRVYRDERTGRAVWQMTGCPGSDGTRCRNVSCYPEVEAFTADERFVIFSSDRTGAWQLYRAELESGELAQLTDVAGFNAISFTIGRDGRTALFTAGRRVYGVDVETGEETLMADLNGVVPDALRDSPVAQSGSGARLAFFYRVEQGVRAIIVVFLDSGERRVVFTGGKVTHPQFCPADEDLLTYVPPSDQNDVSLPREKRARTWTCHLRTGETRPFLMAPKGRRATHDYWDRTGDRLYFHTKTVTPGGPTTISSIARHGGDWRDHVVHERTLGHSSIDRAGRFIVSDVQMDPENELYRIDLETGAAEMLCWPDTTSTKPDQTVHAHPSISAKGTYVDFTSDRYGLSDLYVYPLNQ